MRQVFGEIGGCSDIVILNFNASEHSAVVRCLKNFGWKLRAALTLISNYQSYRCKIDVNKTTPEELGLSKTDCED